MFWFKKRKKQLKLVFGMTFRFSTPCEGDHHADLGRKEEKNAKKGLWRSVVWTGNHQAEVFLRGDRQRGFLKFFVCVIFTSPLFSLWSLSCLPHSLRRSPPFPFPLSFHSPAWCPGVFLEVNEKRNLNCLSLKGMSGSAGWKLVLLMSFTFSVWVGHLWVWVCLLQFRTGILWLEGTWREGGWAYETGLHLQEGESGGVCGIFSIF